MITDKINRFHRRKRTGITRTRGSVKTKINRLGFSVIATENNMSSRKWARMLGLKSDRVRGWTRSRGLNYAKRSSSFIITIEDMTRFAEEKPHLLSSVSEDILSYYFGDELTKIILSNRHKCPDLQPRFKIQRLDNHVIYPSLYKAAKDLGMREEAVKREAQRNGWLRFV
jgi:hypothetical protein